MPLSFSILQINCPLVIAIIFIAGIGGTFHFGYCVSVMTSPSGFIKELVNKTCIYRYNLSLEQWHLSLIWSFTVSIFCIGGLIGALVAGSLISKFGRKRCLLLNNFMAIAGAVLMLLSQTTMSFEMIMAGRFLYGLNSGVGLSAHTMYLLECAPKQLRETVGVTIASFISLGKFSGQLLGISELLGTEKNWPWLLGFIGFTALFQLVSLPFLPESPSFLLFERGDRTACEQAVKRLWGNTDYSKEIEEMLKEKAALQNVRSHSMLELIQNQTVRWQLITIFVTFTSLQLCGINAVYFYSFEVFRAAGIQEHKLPYAALGTGLCELSTSFMIIQRTGKKVLLFRGYVGMSTTLALLTITLYLQRYLFWMPYCSMVLIFIFIFSFACGPAAGTVSLPGEIFSQAFKSSAYTIACTINWTSLFVLGMIFPVLVENLHSFCFIVFLFFCVVAAIYINFIPETRNRTVQEIAAEFNRIHSKSAASHRIAFTDNGLNGVKTYETKF
uniref:Solute carrier family 2, facilitated glucose transporter member 5 n=1 Tax=Acanthochromis polyacanthus TaxID=80966 RepID=A0A3Q1F1S3_9TELE